MPSFKGRGGDGGSRFDAWTVGTLAVAAIAVLGMGYLYVSTSNRYEELSLGVQEQLSDSARYADIISRTRTLQARRDSIAQRVEVIQQIDRDRYLWAHVMDEVARAIPNYVWLTGLLQVGAGETPQFQIRGVAGTNLALTTFMERLEASLFIQRVNLIGTTQEVQQDIVGRSRVVNTFQLEAEYEYPPPEVIETVPLLGGEGDPSESADPGSSGVADADSGV